MNRLNVLKLAGEYSSQAEKEHGFDIHPKTASFEGFIAGWEANELLRQVDHTLTMHNKVDVDTPLHERIVHYLNGLPKQPYINKDPKDPPKPDSAYREFA